MSKRDENTKSILDYIKDKSKESKLDNYVWSEMNYLKEIEHGKPVSVVVLFHHIKTSEEFCKLLGLSKKHEKFIAQDYDVIVPILKDVIGRLQKEDRISEPINLNRS